jgi:hypothetical protein
MEAQRIMYIDRFRRIRFAARIALSALLVWAPVSSLLPAHAADPASGTVNPVNGSSVTWVGTSQGGTSLDSEASCVEGQTCEYFVLTIGGQPSEWLGKVARVELHWMIPGVDYDFYVHKGSPNGPIVARGTQGATNAEMDDIEPAVDGTGLYFIHVVYFTATAADQYAGSVTVIGEPAPPPPAVVGTGLAPRYQNHTPTAEQISQGISRNSQDEPNIDVNWNTGKVFFQALLQTLRVTFSNDDTCPQTPTSFWENKSPVTSATSFDPILFTDRVTGRTIVSQLFFNPIVGGSSFTDDDGETWIPSQGSGVGSGVDHQSVGGGPFHLPLTTGVGYEHAVYYCSQDIALANCALSVNGGLSYGPAVPIYDIRTCGGLHGHIKVGPDGTAYVPNSDCNGTVNPFEQAVVVSEDNGITWDVRTVPGSVGGTGSDPSVAIGDDGTVYLGYTSGDKLPSVAVSEDRGTTWKNMFDVGAQVGIRMAVFPAMVAGEKGRAAMAFYGTTQEGVGNSFTFDGSWRLYIAHTYDGGKTWITVDATPNDALQNGGIHLGGGGEIHRNLLDFFDATVDAEGRVLAGYADGCIGTCAQAALGSRGNSYTAFATIARQSGGRRMYSQFDPAEPTVPGAPRLTATRNGSVTRLSWSQSETGGVPVTGFKVFRRAGSGPEQLIATLGGNATGMVDQSSDPRATYSYRVVASNNLGDSCGTNEVTAEPKGSSCVAPGLRVVDDRTADQTGGPANPDMDIEWISIGEPFFGDGVRKLLFTMKVGSLAAPPPNRMWRILWNYPDAPDPDATFHGRYYVGMNTDDAGSASFEYGVVLNDTTLILVNLLPPIRLGELDPESGFSPDGTIRLVISADKIGNPEAGDLIGGLIGRAYPVAQGETLRSDSASDSVTFASAYALVGNQSCKNPPPTVNCFEENDPAATYANGWHQVNTGNASGGHFRYNTGNDSQHGMRFTFDVSEGANGALVYHYAKSTKGGTADVYIDGVFRESINYRGATGSNRDPQFGFSSRYADLQAGAHTFELRNVQGPAFVDRFCLENAFFSGQASAGPGATTGGTQTINATQAVFQNVQLPVGATAISVVAETNTAVPIQLVLIDPAGAVLQVANSSNGVAVIEVPVAQAGLYVVKVVNVGVGPVQVWTLATPYVQY